MLVALRRHWREYAIEAAGLGIFLMLACLFVALVDYPSSPIRQAVPDPLLRRALLGCAVALTNVAIIYSPWGRRSGAHLNPSLTLTFLRLGKIAPWDAVFYIAAQFAGGVAGVLVAAALLGQRIADPAVAYVVTVPGAAGAMVAWLAECGISFGLMLVVLIASNSRRLAPFTGVCASMLLMTYILLEAPLSGVSMNPARTFGSALPAGVWTALWVYFTAPPLGMQLAGELYRRWRGADAVICAKLHHGTRRDCIFRCGYRAARVADAGQQALPQLAT